MLLLEIPILSEMFREIMNYIPKLPTLLLVVVIGVSLIRLVQRTTRRVLLFARLDKALVQFVTTFIAFAGWVFLISLMFSVLGFPQLSLAFSGSIALILMGVASNATHLIQDLLAGIFLIAEPDFTVGQRVRLNAIVGDIVGLDIKKTKVEDESGHIHVIPNKMFDSNVFVIEPRQKEERS